MKAVIGIVLLVVVGVGAYVMLSRPAPEEAPVAAAPAAAAATPPPATTPAPVAPDEPDRVADAPKKAAPRRALEPPAAPAPVAAALATLVLTTDVPGASVFVNREYAGTTPLRLDRLEPGTKQLKLSADGYDGIERSVELAAGDNPVTLRFKEVRLNKRVGVAHKHGMGGCEGTLVATVDGLAYETSNKGDAFNLSYAQVDSFVVDYMEKNLQVKQKGGKTWNFTDKATANADALFVFHRDVEAARKKLADGYAAVK